jgi:hypothetical protein
MPSRRTTTPILLGFLGLTIALAAYKIDIHEDMLGHFSQYPNEWGLSSPDPNIDHRRVPNLMRFFERQGKSLPVAYGTREQSEISTDGAIANHPQCGPGSKAAGRPIRLADPGALSLFLEILPQMIRMAQPWEE